MLDVKVLLERSRNEMHVTKNSSIQSSLTFSQNKSKLLTLVLWKNQRAFKEGVPRGFPVFSGLGAVG